MKGQLWSFASLQVFDVVELRMLLAEKPRLSFIEILEEVVFGSQREADQTHDLHKEGLNGVEIHPIQYKLVHVESLRIEQHRKLEWIAVREVACLLKWESEWEVLRLNGVKGAIDHEHWCDLAVQLVG